MVVCVGCYSDFLDDNSFDYIVVGAGTTGSIVAARLAEDPDVEVLLLEAGDKPLPISEIPFLSVKALGSEMDWNYLTEPQKTCCSIFKNQMTPVHAGKALGGTSSLNFMTYIRGNPNDFDKWEKLGNKGWNYKKVFPYFMKMENYKIPHTRDTKKYHSIGGPITVMTPPFTTPFANVFLKAGMELKQPWVDYNAKGQTGFMYPPKTIHKGKRLGTNTAYLDPNVQKPNFHLSANSFVIKINFDKQLNAIGLVYEKNLMNVSVTAKREVILSAGTINSPKLLMLSGIGPIEELQQLKIPVINNLPGVGQNLQDHVSLIGNTYYVNQELTLQGMRYDTKDYLDLWKNTRTGPMTCPGGFEGLAFFNSSLNKDLNWPDIAIMMSTGSIWMNEKPYINRFFKFFLPSKYKDSITLLPYVIRPKSKGYITINSSNPHDQPVIDPQYLSHPDDVEVLIEAMRFIDNIMSTDEFQKYAAILFNKGVVPQCVTKISENPDEYTKCLVRILSSPAYHYAGTCKMGVKSDKLSVVDHRLRVHGVKGLRIADASIMPTIIAAHPGVTCMMIGEKAADMIKEEWSQNIRT